VCSNAKIEDIPREVFKGDLANRLDENFANFTETT